jgi:UDP-3-O-[3-hydroxymyristoyl] glucosamine N-acyltransferase
MADSRFFKCAGPFTATELAQLCGAQLKGDESRIYTDVASLENANSQNVSFLDNRRYVEQFEKSAAGICLIHPDLVDRAPQAMSLLITKEPYMAYAKIARAFYPESIPPSEISERAYIDESAILGQGVCIEAGAYIAKGVVIGDRSWIKANAVLSDGVIIGNDCIISSNVTISHAMIANAVTIHPGCQIGQDGFGFASGAQGHVRIPQLGRVIIHDHVNIGANSTVDRGAGPDTVIGAGTQIDNLVQIGHNVEIGMGCVLVSQSGVSGSTKLGNFVVVAGKAGISGHLTIGDGVTIAAKAGVMNNIDAGQTVGGFPAILQKDWLRQTAAIRKLVKNKK